MLKFNIDNLSYIPFFTFCGKLHLKVKKTFYFNSKIVKNSDFWVKNVILYMHIKLKFFILIPCIDLVR